MKKLLALLFVCAGLTAMAINPQHVNKFDGQQMKQGNMLLKSNKLSKDLTMNMTTNKQMRVGQKGSLNEFVKTHDMSQNRLMRAPRRGNEYIDMATGWLYTGIENTVANGEATPSWYSISGMTFEIDTIYEEDGWCELYLGVMPFLTDPDGSGTTYDAGHYTIFPDCYAWYELATDSIGIFSGWGYKYPLTASRTSSGMSNYRITARYWYTGIGNEEAILGTGGLTNTASVGVVDWNTGMITFDQPFGPIEAQVYKTITISRTNYNKVLSYLASGADVYDVAWALASYQAFFKNEGITYTMNTTDSTFYSNGLYTDNMFLLSNATHNFDAAFKAETTDSVFVELSYENADGEIVTYQEVVRDSIVNESVPVFLYQNATNDTVYAWNLWGLSNYPDVEFGLDADANLTFFWQPVYYEDMTEFTEYYQNNGYDYTFTNQFLNFHATYAPYDLGGETGYYMADIDWDDTPCEMNDDMNEITWNATEIMDVFTTTTDEYYHMGVGFKAAWINNKLTLDFGLELPEPEETWALGDVNHDGKVDVSDVTLLISYVLGNDPDIFYLENANVYQDANGRIDVSDVTALIAMVLG